MQNRISISEAERESRVITPHDRAHLRQFYSGEIETARLVKTLAAVAGVDHTAAAMIMLRRPKSVPVTAS